MLIHALLCLHLISLICWFAGLFYLPRLFVYHAMTNNLEIKNQFLIMERKLYFYIMTPAMVLTIISGYTLMSFLYHAPYPIWLHIKLSLVILLIIFHIFSGYYFFKFKNNLNTHSDKFFRYFNEVPTVLLILIIVLIIFQPSF